MSLTMNPESPASSPIDEKKKSTPFRRKFTQEEDDKIRYLVEEKGMTNWSEIAELVQNRTTKQCRDRYNNYLSPGITNKPWTNEEDDLLREKVREMGNKWTEIALFFNGRGPNNIKNRWHKVLLKEEQDSRKYGQRTVSPPSFIRQIQKVPYTLTNVAILPYEEDCFSQVDETFEWFIE